MARGEATRKKNAETSLFVCAHFHSSAAHLALAKQTFSYMKRANYGQKNKTKQNGHVLRSYEHQVLSNLNGDLAGQIPVKKETLFSALPSTQTIISTNFYSSHKELGKALFMYQTRLNTSQYLWRQNNWEQLKIRELQTLAKQTRARSRKKGKEANREKKIYLF